MSETSIRQSGRVGRYLWALSQFTQEKRVLTTSHEISVASGVNPSQVRRDLSMLLGRSGKRGVGYDVKRTLGSLRSQATFQVYGDGPVSRAFRDATTLNLLGVYLVGSGFPDVAVLDYPKAADGRAAAASLANAGVSLIVNYGSYLLDSDLAARVVNASPLLAVAEAVS